MTPAVFAPAARAELEAAAEWYEVRAPGPGQQLVLSVDEAIQRISEAPVSFPKWEGDQRSSQCRTRRRQCRRRRRVRWLVRRRLGSYTHVVDLELTAVFKKVPEGYIAFVEELPGANTQGATLDEARENLHEAVRLVLEANREFARQDDSDDDVIREQIRVANG